MAHSGCTRGAGGQTPVFSHFDEGRLDRTVSVLFAAAVLVRTLPRRRRSEDEGRSMSVYIRITRESVALRRAISARSAVDDRVQWIGARHERDYPANHRWAPPVSHRIS